MKRTLFTIGLGASLMYFFDPKEGPARRERLRESFESLLPQTNQVLHEKANEISAKAHELTTKADEVAADAIASVKTPTVEKPEPTPPEMGLA